MKNLKWLFLLIHLGCGAYPADQFVTNPQIRSERVGSTVAVGFRISNDYAESLFTLSVTTNDNPTPTLIFNKTRIEAFDSMASGGRLEAQVGGEIGLTFTAMSLGENNYFGTIYAIVPAITDPVYSFRYDFDLATAEFIVRHGWR